MRPANMFYVSSVDDSEGFFLPNPDKDSGTNLISTFVNQARNANAVVIAQKIGRDQEKTELSWNYLAIDEWERMLRFWNDNFFFNFTYYSRVEGERITRKFYIGDRSDRPFDIDATGVPTVAYLDCVANVIDTGEGS